MVPSKTRCWPGLWSPDSSMTPVMVVFFFRFDSRCYCFECVDILVGPGTSERINAMACWVCFLCLPFSRSGLLQRRKKWRHQLKAFHDREGVRTPGAGEGLDLPPAAGCPLTSCTLITGRG